MMHWIKILTKLNIRHCHKLPYVTVQYILQYTIDENKLKIDLIGINLQIDTQKLKNCVLKISKVVIFCVGCSQSVVNFYFIYILKYVHQAPYVKIWYSKGQIKTSVKTKLWKETKIKSKLCNGSLEHMWLDQQKHY